MRYSLSLIVLLIVGCGNSETDAWKDRALKAEAEVDRLQSLDGNQSNNPAMGTEKVSENVHQVSLTWAAADAVPPRAEISKQEGESLLDATRRRNEAHEAELAWIGREWWMHNDLKFTKMVQFGYRVVKREANAGQVWVLLEGDEGARTKLETEMQRAIEQMLRKMEADRKAEEDERKRVASLPWDRVVAGMTKQEVESLLGKPTERHWDYWTYGGLLSSVSVIFDDTGRVVEVFGRK